MFGLFKSKSFSDPQLGVFQRRSAGYTRASGNWRGTISLMQGAATDLFLAGSREGPDPAAIDLAHDLVKSYKSLQTQIETHLFEHYRAYDPAIDGGEHVDPYPKILTASAVWPEVTLVYVSIAPLRGSPAAGSIIEIAYSVSWDEEHTAGARIQNGRLFELCGSV